MNGFNFPPPPDEPVPVVPRDIKAKRIVPSPRKAPTVRSGKGSIFGKASIPSVYWAGDDPTPGGNEEYTFYREGTPPPSEKGGGRQRGLSLYDQERRAARGQDRRNRKCCGLRMWVFWLLVCLIILVVLGVGVGVGVGVGLGASKANQSDESAARTRYDLSRWMMKLNECTDCVLVPRHLHQRLASPPLPQRHLCPAQQYHPPPRRQAYQRRPPLQPRRPLLHRHHQPQPPAPTPSALMPPTRSTAPSARTSGSCGSAAWTTRATTRPSTCPTCWPAAWASVWTSAPRRRSAPAPAGVMLRRARARRS